MKQRICPVCGHLEKAGTEYCTECNTKTIEFDDGTGEPETGPEEEPQIHVEKKTESRKKDSRGQAGGSKSKGVPLGKIGIVAVLVIVGLVFWNRHMNQEDSGSDVPSGSGASSSVPESDAESSTGTMAGDEDGNGGEPAQSSGNYELIVADVTWTEAYEDCLSRGGRLVRIDSEEEGQAIWQQIVSEGKEYVGIWIGEVDEAANGTTRGYYEISADGYSSTGNIDIDTMIRLTVEGTGASVGYICEYGGEVPPEQESPTEMPAEGIAVEEGINSYELIVADVTWSQAYYDCMDRGGHLVRITTDAEYQAILQQIASEGKENIIFWLGGARNDDSGYYWIYDDGYFGSEVLNEDAKYASYWLDGEPSFHDDAAGVDETRMNMFRLSSSGQWVWNDVPDDILSVASFYSGKIGYICEYE